MRSIIIASALAGLIGTASANAVTIANVSGSGALTFSNTAAGLLQADFALAPSQSVTLDLEVEAGDAGGISFDSFVDLFSLSGVSFVTLSLTNGATFSTVGSAEGAFSTAAASGPGAFVTVSLTPAEFVSLVLGDIGFGGTDWLITPGPGDTGVGDFSLTIAAVPAPAALALFGLGLVGLAAARRR